MSKEVSQLYHYTSMNALFHILNGIENGNLTLRATHYEYLNDRSECQYFQQFYSDKYKMKNIVEHLDADYDDNVLYEAFIISLSRKSDDLTMWRLYSKNNGISLGFDYIELQNLFNDRLKECSYISSRKEFYDAVAEYKFCNSYAFEPSYIGAFIKHPSFKDESEYRICYQPFKKDVKFFEKDGLIKPYIDIQIPVSALKQIWLAPGCNEELSRKSILMLLGSKEVTHITENDIIHSKHPYIDR